MPSPLRKGEYCCFNVIDTISHITQLTLVDVFIVSQLRSPLQDEASESGLQTKVYVAPCSNLCGAQGNESMGGLLLNFTWMLASAVSLAMASRFVSGWYS